eukprot:TRINITY_DN12128_c0_g1_i1.p1 TRINITY_DN12128_c0_g1~~TRINITY_DN12128_c0_g1_i1.p1  ORF type:complete len:167 (+),score=23.27 TRINITY_DN12128_c0_g1_i1:102-602(+)
MKSGLYTNESELANLAALVTSGFWSSVTFGRFLVTIFAPNASPVQILSADMIGSFFSILIFLLFPTNLPVICICTLVFGLCMATTFPSLISLSSWVRLSKGKVAVNIEQALLLCCAALGGTLSSLTGFMIQYFGNIGMLWWVIVNVVLQIVMLVIILCILPSKKPK